MISTKFLANPKSHIFMLRYSSNNILWDFKSRWATLDLCKNNITFAISLANFIFKEGFNSFLENYFKYDILWLMQKCEKRSIR
jgi:hypothetical protein